MRRNALPHPIFLIGSSVKDPILLLPIESGCVLRVRTSKWCDCL